MMKHLYLCFLLYCLAGGVVYAAPVEHRVIIKSVVIEENGEWSPELSSQNIPREVCADFLLTDSDVIKFFKQAQSVSKKQYYHDLDISRCYARGHLVLKNGKKAEWFIDRFRRGSINFQNGTKFFYCEKCQFKVFDDVD
jgi:hypothetical protein